MVSLVGIGREVGTGRIQAEESRRRLVGGRMKSELQFQFQFRFQWCEAGRQESSMTKPFRYL